MKVLVVANHSVSSHLGGAEVASFASAQALARRGHQPRILSVLARGSTRSERTLSIDGIPVREVRLRRPLRSRWLDLIDPGVGAVVAAEIRRHAPDVIHVHNLSGASLAPLLAAARAAVPTAVTLHDHWLLCANNMLLRADLSRCEPGPGSCTGCFRGYDHWAAVPRRRAVMRLAARQVARFVSPSQRLVDLHVQAGFDPGRFEVLRHGLPWLTAGPGGPDPEVAAIHQRWRTLAYVGAIAVNKGIRVLVDAVAGLAAREPLLHLLLAGQGDPALERRVRALGDAATVLGPVGRAGIASVYAGAALTAVPSIWEENSPISLCESLMAGTPVVASRIGGIPELVVEGETGWLVPAGDPGALGEAVRHHFALPARRVREMRRACVQWAREELSPARHAIELERILAGLRAGPSVAPSLPAPGPIP